MNKKIWEIDSLKEFRELNKDFFIKHKATLEKLKGNDGKDCLITFKRDDTTDGAMMFTYINGVLSISGDYGNVMFNWYNKNNHILAYGTFDSFGYILSKIVASEDYKKFDVDLFYKEFEEWKNRLVEEEYITIEKMSEIDEPMVDSNFDVQEYFRDFNLVDDVYEFGVYEFGTYITERPYIWWYGLQSALNQLEDNGEFKDENNDSISKN